MFKSLEEQQNQNAEEDKHIQRILAFLSKFDVSTIPIGWQHFLPSWLSLANLESSPQY